MKKRMIAVIMAALLILSMAACGGGAAEGTTTAGPDRAIQIATKPMTEQFILSEMLKLIIEDSTGYKVEITKGIGGGTKNIQPAMEKGEFDLYPEYTSSGYVMVLGHPASEVNDDTIMDELNKEYGEKFDMSWVGLYGFNNTYAMVASKAAAEEYNLVKTSDIQNVNGQLVFGGNPDYLEREDGFPMVCDTYGIEFKDVKDIDIGLKYEALRSGDIDVTNGYTTDAQIGSGDVVVLEDDKHLQVNYFASTVVRNEALKEFPGLEEALMKMDGLLSDAEMAGLNYKLEVEGQDEAAIAKDYLVSKGIIKE